MKYIIAGDKKLHGLSVAFHLRRDNSFAPWEIIGVVIGFGSRSDCYYHPKHKHIEEEFRDECLKAGTLSGTYDFIDGWHRRYQRRNEVVTKVINYYVSSESLHKIVRDIAWSYVLRTSPNRFIRLTIMLRSRERYIPVVFNPTQQKSKSLISKLIEAGKI